MTTHFSILAWRIPWTEKPGRLQSIDPQRLRHDWATDTHKEQRWEKKLIAMYIFQKLHFKNLKGTGNKNKYLVKCIDNNVTNLKHHFKHTSLLSGSGSLSKSQDMSSFYTLLEELIPTPHTVGDLFLLYKNPSNPCKQIFKIKSKQTHSG